MSDSSAPVRHDDQPLSDDQLSQIAGGGPKGGGGMSVSYPCDICGQNFTTLDALTRHQTPHP